jgi:hypothetical protein
LKFEQGSFRIDERKYFYTVGRKFMEVFRSYRLKGLAKPFQGAQEIHIKFMWGSLGIYAKPFKRIESNHALQCLLPSFTF